MALETDQSYSSDYKHSVEETEWNRLKEFRLKEGFVGGKSLGEESTLQSGFDHGYVKGFEISFPISVIKGFLSVNELLLRENGSSLLTQARKVKESLSEFDRKCSEFKLSCVRFVNERNSNECLADIHNDNVDFLLREKVCPDTGETYNIDRLQWEEINSEFDVLKDNILSFLSECEQPLLLDQISKVFEKWDSDRVTQFEDCAPKYPDEFHASSGDSSLHSTKQEA